MLGVRDLCCGKLRRKKKKMRKTRANAIEIKTQIIWFINFAMKIATAHSWVLTTATHTHSLANDR